MALSGAGDEPGEPGELCEQCEPSEPGQPSEPGKSGWNVTMAVSGGEEERPSFFG